MAEKRHWFKETLDWLHHAYWIREFLLSSAAAAAAMKWLVSHISALAQYGWSIWLLLAATFMYGADFVRRRVAPRPTNEQNQLLSLATSAASGEEAFDIARFMRTTYHSVMQPDFEASVRRWLDQIQAKDREAASVSFIANGLIAFLHDTTWWTIYKSQLLALDALNRSILRKEQVKEFYDAAAKETPKYYATYSFEDWFGYLKGRVLIIELPADTVGITERGKDFLKHVVHWGHARDRKHL